MIDLIRIENSTGTAKYKQIVNSILEAIESEKLVVGDKIPSLNALVKEFGLSQDTVLTAYNELRHRGIISSSVGKGYYVAKTDTLDHHHIFVLFDKMTAYKEVLYEAMKSTAGEKVTLDIYFHHGNQTVFNNLLSQAMGTYSVYVVVPIISDATLEMLAEFPLKKVYILDQGIEKFGKKYRSVCQNFREDIQSALGSVTDRIKSYRKFFLVQEDKRQQFIDLQQGFRRFCSESNIMHGILPSLRKHQISAGDLYLTINDHDLVDFMRQCREQGLKPGENIGIISYNDTPLKEFIADGISTISTDFERMGQSVIEMILENRTRHLTNPSRLIMRQSF